MESELDVERYYSSYASRILLRPGYPARAQYKSSIMWRLFGRQLLSLANEIKDYADIGGCHGFGANCMAYHIAQAQDGRYPRTRIFETVKEYELGNKLFPHMEFIIELRQKFCYPGGGVKTGEMIRCAKSKAA